MAFIKFTQESGKISGEVTIKPSGIVGIPNIIIELVSDPLYPPQHAELYYGREDPERVGVKFIRKPTEDSVPLNPKPVNTNIDISPLLALLGRGIANKFNSPITIKGQFLTFSIGG